MLSFEVKWSNNCQMDSQKPKYCKRFERNSHWRKLSMIMVWERYCYSSPKPELFFLFFVYIFIHISVNMSPFGLKFSQMILHTETSKLMYNWPFLFVVLLKPTLSPSTCNDAFEFFSGLNFTPYYRHWCHVWPGSSFVKVETLLNNAFNIWQVKWFSAH